MEIVNFSVRILPYMSSSNAMPNLPIDVIVTSILSYRSIWPLVYLDGHGVFSYFFYLNVKVVVLDFNILIASEDALIFLLLLRVHRHFLI